MSTTAGAPWGCVPGSPKFPIMGFYSLHDPAIFYDPATDTFEELGGGSGIPLGVDESIAYEANEKSGLAKDHIIFIGTDGIWETHNPKGEMLGKEPVP